MNLNDFFKNQSVPEMKKTLKMIKDKIKKRNDLIQAEGTQNPEATKLIKHYKKYEGGSVGPAHRRLIFSLPSDVYYSNREYWKDIINNKKFYLHPEYQIKFKRK